MKDFRITFAAARVNAGFTQDAVAKELHVSKHTIVNWEKGITEPSVNQARAISELYKTPLDYIFLPCKSN